MPTTQTTTTARDAQAFDLRQQGTPLEAIRIALGYGRGTGTVSRAIRREAIRRGYVTVTTTGERNFGIEIEFVLPIRYGQAADIAAVIGALRNAGLQVADYTGYTHAVIPQWKVVYDGSVGGSGRHGLELVSPILNGEAGLAQVKVAMQALRGANATVNGTCGMHVHHDANDLTGDQIAALVEGYQRLHGSVDTLVARSRRGNRWARRMSAHEVTHAVQTLRGVGTTANKKAHLARMDRYRSVNLTAYAKYGTVEFRQHQGTLDAKKAAAWVRLGWAMVANAQKATPDTYADVLDLAADNGMAPATVTYLRRRRAVLA